MIKNIDIFRLKFIFDSSNGLDTDTCLIMQGRFSFTLLIIEIFTIVKTQNLSVVFKPDIIKK